MNLQLKYRWVMLLSFSLLLGHAQNETKKWYFGWGAALDFMSNPPANISGTGWSNNVSFASIADANGDLMFYTNGINIWTNTHTVMANGSGLSGSGGANAGGNGVLILQKPSSANLYYVFTILASGSSNADGLYYSVVDMNLASGQGSVTVKNTQMYSGSLCRKLTGTRHCNGTDFWIVAKECSNSNTNIWNGIYNFLSYQFSSSGVSTTPAASGFTYNATASYANSVKIGQMKISPSGKKLACANYGFSSQYNSAAASIELYDFNNSTGQVSNFFPLYIIQAGYSNGSAFGVEFSPDASKLYGSMSNNIYYSEGSLLEWDLCASSNSAIAASKVAVSTPSYNINGYGCMQLAPDGKIYVAPYNFLNTSLSVINSPDQYGSATNFSMANTSILPGSVGYMLPNFISSSFFLTGSVPAFSLSLAGGSGACQQGQFHAPISLGTSVGTCSANSYTLQGVKWDFGDPGSGQNNFSTIHSPIHYFSAPGIYNVKLTLDFGCGNQHVSTQTISAGGAVGSGGGPGNLNFTSTLVCNGINTGTASYSGSANSNLTYFWTNGNVTYTSASVLNLGAGTWTSLVTNTLSACVFSTVFSIQQPPAITITPVVSPVCLNSSLTVNASGGASPLSYLWSNGATTATTTCTIIGPHSATVTDAKGCKSSINFTVSPPIVLAAKGASICSGNTATLAVMGVSNYTWWAGNIVSPTTSSSYSLTGENNGCYKDTLVTVIVYPPPTVLITTDQLSACKNETLLLIASGALNYIWHNNVSGPSLIYSNGTSGTYVLTVKGTNSNSCSNTATLQLNILNCITGIEDPYLNDEVRVFPNPSNGDIFIQANEGRAFLYNSVGEMLWNKELSESRHFFLEVSGIYFLGVETGAKVRMYKLIVL